MVRSPAPQRGIGAPRSVLVDGQPELFPHRQTRLFREKRILQRIASTKRGIVRVDLSGSSDLDVVADERRIAVGTATGRAAVAGV